MGKQSFELQVITQLKYSTWNKCFTLFYFGQKAQPIIPFNQWIPIR